MAEMLSAVSETTAELDAEPTVELSAEQTQLRESGFVVFKELLGRDDVARLRAASLKHFESANRNIASALDFTACWSGRLTRWSINSTA